MNLSYIKNIKSYLLTYFRLSKLLHQLHIRHAILRHMSHDSYCP